MRRCQFGHRDRVGITQPGLLRWRGRPQTFRKAGDLTGKSGNGHLLVVLERRDGALGLGKGGDEMAQGHGVGMAVGFTRRCGNQSQTRTDVACEIAPSGEPAAGGAQREDQPRGLPCAMGGGCGCALLKKLEKLTGPQRAVGNDVMPMHRKCTSAA